MTPNIWSDGHGTVYLRWGDRGPYRWITESGETGERFTLPAGAGTLADWHDMVEWGEGAA